MPSDLRHGYDYVPLRPLGDEQSSPTAPPISSAYDKRAGILLLTPDVPSSSTPSGAASRPAPRWWTHEFKAYYVVFAVAIPLMVWKAYDLSRGASSLSFPDEQDNSSCTATHPNFVYYEHMLSQGWMFGRLLVRLDCFFLFSHPSTIHLCH